MITCDKAFFFIKGGRGERKKKITPDTFIVATSLIREVAICHRVCKSVSGPIFGLCSEHLSVVLRGIGLYDFRLDETLLRRR